jgi:hypothetical protein
MVLCGLLSTSSLASDNSQVDSAQTDLTQQTFSPGWSGYLSATYSDNWANDYRDDRNITFDVSLGYRFTDQFSVGVISGTSYLDTQYCSTHTKDYWCVSPTYLYAKYNNLYQFFSNFITVGLQGRILLPTYQYAHDTKLKFGLKGSMPFAFDIDRYIKGLSVAITPSVTKYFNEYKTAGNKVLTEYTFALGLNTTYQLFDEVYLSFNLSDSQNITYLGNSTYPTISHNEELGYQATSSLYIGVGYTNNAQFFSPEEGPNPLSSLFDDRDPHFYLTTSYSF